MLRILPELGSNLYVIAFLLLGLALSSIERGEIMQGLLDD